MGCFWGAERKYWQQSGVFSTMVCTTLEDTNFIYIQAKKYLIWKFLRIILNSVGQQFYQYQQNEQPPLTSRSWKPNKTVTYNVENPSPTGTKLW